MTRGLQRLIPRRLIHQVALVTALLISVSSASITVYFVHENLEQKFDNLEQGIHALGTDLANISAAHLLIQNLSTIRDIALQAGNYPNIRMIEFIDHDKRVLLKVTREPGAEIQLKVTPNSFATGMPTGKHEHHLHSWLYAQGGGHDLFFSKLEATGLSAWHPIERGDLGWIHIEADTASIRKEAEHGLIDGVLFVLFAVVSSIGLIYLVFFYQFRALSRVSRFASTLRSKDGQQTRVYSGSEEIELLCRVLNDASRQLHADAQSIELSHVRNDALFRNLKDVIISADEQGIIESVNPSVYLLLGYMADELIGKSVEVIIPNQHRTAHHHGMRRYLEDGAPKILGRDVEIEALHRDGHTVPIRLALTEYWTGTERHFAATLHDLKDEIHLRQTEQARQVAEAASQSKSDFLAHMSHEIRTPMNGVLGMVDVLMASPLDDRQRKLARIIQDSANTQLNILNDILDFSKIESGNQELASEAFALKQTLQDICEAMQFHASQKQVALECQTDESTATTLMGDALRLRQILNNLISNAIKFSATQTAGQVTLHAAVKPADENRVWLVITVSDNGIGIAPEVLPQLFRPFTQADSSTTKHFGGTGLGLAISQRLAKLMDGEISVESKVGQGSSFTVRLRMQTASEQEAAANPTALSALSPTTPVAVAAAPAHAAPGSPAKILVAEDNETNQEVIQEQLTQLGYSADIAKDGQQAYELWHSQHYDLILSDIQMPRMDGRELAATVRRTQAQEGRPSIPIISISANVTEAPELNQVFDCNLIKPTSLTELGSALKKWLPPGGRPQPAPADSRASETQDTPTATADAAESRTFPLWDPAVLPSLVGDEPAMHQRLLKKFLLNVAQRKTAIEAAMAAGQAEEVGAQAHALKSAARSIGAMRLGELCFSLEEAGRHGDNESCERLVQEFDTLYAQSEEIIRQQLAPDWIE